jgi:hypothetical protein
MAATKLRVGQPVTWAKITDGPRGMRTGVIWSAGRTPAQWWVQPADDPARPVLVQRRGKGNELYEVPSAGEYARLAMLRGEHMRQRGIFAVLDNENSLLPSVKWHCDPGCELAQGKEAYDRVRHGYAIGCEVDARHGYAGKEAGEVDWLSYEVEDFGERTWTPIDAVIALLDGGELPPELCKQCIVPAEHLVMASKAG